MPWTPSEADRRADKLMLELKDAAEACGINADAVLYPMYQARVFDLISKAIDQALADGSGKSYVDQIIDNAPSWEAINLKHASNGHAPEATADPVGFDSVIEAHEEGPGSTSVFSIDPLNLGDVQLVPMGVSDAPKKKRGRPKGSKAKKAKVAKGQKAKDAVENGADPNVVPFSGELHAGQTETEPEPTIDLVQ